MGETGNFDGYSYFEQICSKNKLAIEQGFRFCRVMGLHGMEEAISGIKKHTCFFCVDDTNDGTTVQSNGGFFKRRVFTVFLLKRYKFGDMEEQHRALEVCRRLYDQICSRMIVDKEELGNQLIYLNTERIHFREMEKYFLSGCAGVYFMIDVDEPINLCYEPEQWEG